MENNVKKYSKEYVEKRLYNQNLLSSPIYIKNLTGITPVSSGKKNKYFEDFKWVYNRSDKKKEIRLADSVVERMQKACDKIDNIIQSSDVFRIATSKRFDNRIILPKNKNEEWFFMFPHVDPNRNKQIESLGWSPYFLFGSRSISIIDFYKYIHESKMIRIMLPIMKDVNCYEIAKSKGVIESIFNISHYEMTVSYIAKISINYDELLKIWIEAINIINKREHDNK